MRDAFLFYRSFHESAKVLNDEDRLALYDTIIDFALNQTETETKPMVNAFFSLIKPQIQANNRKYENGKKGGRPSQTETKAEPKENQTETKAEPNVKEKEKEKVKDKDIPAKASLVDEYALTDTSLTDQGKEYLNRFLTYRKKIKSPIKTTAPLKIFINVLRELVKLKYNPDSVFELMESKEWQTIKIEWVEKELKSNSTAQPQTHEEKMAFKKEAYPNGTYLDWYGTHRDSDGFAV